MMAKDFGVVAPRAGRWIWPLAEMEIGDRFYVPHEEREPQRVRNYVMVRGYDLGFRFSVIKDSDRPGYTKVERIDPTQGRARTAAYVLYGVICERIKESYGEVIDFDWHTGFEIGETQFVAKPRIAEPQREALVMKIEAYNLSFLVELKPQGVQVTRLKDGMTWHDYQEALELMS